MTLQMPSIAASFLPYLSAHTRQEFEAGHPVTLTTENWEAFAAAHQTTSVPTKLRRMLELVGRLSRRPGERVSLPIDSEPLVDAAESGELTFLLETLAERRLLKGPDNSRWAVTAAGWEALDPMSPGGVAGTCFVAMSFDPSLEAAFIAGIRPAVEKDCKFMVNRVDRRPHNEDITDRIRIGIRAAQLVVADFTLQRQGVYYEAGLAEGLGRTVIRCCRSDDFDNLHFDTRQFFHLKWETPTDLRKQLADHIRATVSPLPAGALKANE
jgi:hypothetical protein